MKTKTQSANTVSEEEIKEKTVYCLAIDVVGSTKASLSLPSWVADRFNRALVQHIPPHLTKLELEHAVVKFTGDGWLVMLPTAVTSLACLALIFRDRFSKEIAKLCELPQENIPIIRAALCSGRDIEVKTPEVSVILLATARVVLIAPCLFVWITRFL